MKNRSHHELSRQMQWASEVDAATDSQPTVENAGIRHGLNNGGPSQPVATATTRPLLQRSPLGATPATIDSDKSEIRHFSHTTWGRRTQASIDDVYRWGRL